MYMGKNIEGFYTAMVAFASVWHGMADSTENWQNLQKQQAPIAWPD
jgi:hypothetical protein